MSNRELTILVDELIYMTSTKLVVKAIRDIMHDRAEAFESVAAGHPLKSAFNSNGSAGEWAEKHRCIEKACMTLADVIEEQLE